MILKYVHVLTTSGSESKLSMYISHPSKDQEA